MSSSTTTDPAARSRSARSRSARSRSARSTFASRPAGRALWLVLALFWTAFAVLEGLNHGPAGWAAGLFGLIAPDLSMLIGARLNGTGPLKARLNGARPIGARLGVGRAAGRRPGRLAPAAVPYYNALHRMVVPLAIAALYAIGPWHLPALFAALCGWMAHIAWDRALGFGLRHRDGTRRG